VVGATGCAIGAGTGDAAVDVDAVLKSSKKPGMGGGESGRGICSWVIGSVIRVVGSRTVDLDNSSWASWKSSWEVWDGVLLGLAVRE
jgi:hypothetical protein